MSKTPSSNDKRPRVKCFSCEIFTSESARARLKAEIPKFSYTEATRLKFPVYDIALKELYEEGCTYAARYFEQLVEKENSLIEESRIGIRVKQDRNLVFDIVEKIKSAERAARLVNGGGMELTLILLYQIINLIEEHQDKYEWLVGDVYSIIVKIVDKGTGDEYKYQEYKARIYTKYGRFLSKSAHSLEDAINRLTEALTIAKGSTWASQVNDPDSLPLDQDIAIQLCEILLANGRKLRHSDIGQSLELAQRAVTVISEVGIASNRRLYCKASLFHSEILRKSGNSEAALKVLCKIQKQIATSLGPDYILIRSALNLQQSICFYQLKDNCTALKKVRQSLKLSEQCQLKVLRGKGLIQLGKICGSLEDNKNREYAKIAFNEAKIIFAELKDVDNEKRAKYLSSKVFADQMFPSLVQLIYTSSDNFSDMISLRNWKNGVQPFWRTTGPDMRRDQKVNEIIDEIS